jgi:hypothetical protein
VKNKIEDLRNHLFATLEALQDKDTPMEIERAKAVAEVAKVIVDSAKVEVDFAKATGQVSGSGFLPAAPKEQQAGTPTQPRLVKGAAQ